MSQNTCLFESIEINLLVQSLTNKLFFNWHCSGRWPTIKRAIKTMVCKSVCNVLRRRTETLRYSQWCGILYQHYIKRQYCSWKVARLVYRIDSVINTKFAPNWINTIHKAAVKQLSRPWSNITPLNSRQAILASRKYYITPGLHRRAMHLSLIRYHR